MSFANSLSQKNGGYGNRQLNYKVEIVEVPASAIGLIIGSKGRNVKELNKTDGIHNVWVDPKTSSVVIKGTDEGIRLVKHRIDKAVCLATNHAGYFPEITLTCLRLEGKHPEIKFHSISSYDDGHIFGGGVRLEQLDARRNYFLFNVKDNLASSQPLDDSIAWDLNGLVGRSDKHIVKPFFERCIRNNIPAMKEESACTRVGVNFGKTFLSSVPDDEQGIWLSPPQINALKYGSGGIRPEFVRHIHAEFLDPLLNSVHDYVPMSIGEYAVIHCISKKAMKRYTIKLKLCDDDSLQGETSFVAAMMKEIAEAKSYFEVLGVADSPSITSHDVEIAYRQRTSVVQPDNNGHPQAGQALEVLNEARACLKDDQQRDDYSKRSLSHQLPRNRFILIDDIDGSKPLPDIQKFTSKDRKLGLLNIMGHAAQSEFRTTIEIEKDEAFLDRNLRRKLQEAWEERTSDNKFQFPGGTDDWFVVETVQYKESEKFSNGKFVLKIDKCKEDQLGKSMEGINISLESVAVDNALSMLKYADEDSDQEALVKNLLESLLDLQNEASKISKLLDSDGAYRPLR